MTSMLAIAIAALCAIAYIATLKAGEGLSETVIRRRLADSRGDIAHAGEFDYLIVNDDFATALADPMVGPASERAERICRDAGAVGAEAMVVSRIPGASHCASEGGGKCVGLFPGIGACARLGLAGL